MTRSLLDFQQFDPPQTPPPDVWDEDPRSDAEPQHSRRSFLRGSALATAVGVPAAFLASSSEHAAHAFGLSRIREPFESIRRNENIHVIFLKTTLGPNARPKPTFQNLNTRTFREFASMSRTFENTGTQAYLGAAPAILSRIILAAAGSIATIEARQAGYLRVLLDETVSINDESFESPLGPQEVAAAVRPFIASLNGGPPLAYNPREKSLDNDIRILNFALLLEQLEAEFYNLNFPRFFR